MNRTRCPGCNERLDHPLLIACPTCGVVFAQYEHVQSELLEQQKESLANELAERVKHRLERREQEKNDLVSEVARLTRSRLRWELIGGVLFLLTVSGLGIFQAYKASINFAANSISEKIATQFAEPNIKETLNQVANTHASEILTKEVLPAAESARKEIQFFVLIQRAANDERKAFDELVEVEKNAAHPLHDSANEAILTIVANLIPNVVFHPIDPQNHENYLSKLEHIDLQSDYRKTIRIYRVSFLTGIWMNKKVSKREKLDFAATVIRDDDSLRAVEAARQILDEEAKIGADVRDVAKYLEWWERNRERY